MRATVLYSPGDVGCVEVEQPKILEPTDAIIKLSATCICGSDLWPYRGLQPVNEPAHIGHEYCGEVVEVGSAVKTVRPGPVRGGIVLPFRQHLPAMPVRLPVLMREPSVYVSGAGALCTRPTRRRNSCGHPRNARR